MKKKINIEEPEDVRSNPDQLREDQGMFAHSHITAAQALMGQAVEHLQGRQREVYILTMREGLSIARAAMQLDITKSTAQVYRDRAIKFITQYCKQEIKNDNY